MVAAAAVKSEVVVRAKKLEKNPYTHIYIYIYTSLYTQELIHTYIDKKVKEKIEVHINRTKRKKLCTVGKNKELYLQKVCSQESLLRRSARRIKNSNRYVLTDIQTNAHK